MSNDSRDSQKKKPGPDPERLKLPHEDWGDAVKEAITVRTIEYEGEQWGVRLIPPKFAGGRDAPDLPDYNQATLVFSGPQIVRVPIPGGFALKDWTDDMLRERLRAFLSR